VDQDKINEYNKSLRESAKEQALLDAISNSSDSSSSAIIEELSKTHKVKVENDLASPSDIGRVVDAVDSLSNKLQPTDIKPVVDALKSVTDAIGTLPTSFPDFPAFPKLPTPPKEVGVTNLSELEEYFNKVVTAVNSLQTSIKFDPKIEVKPADVVVNEKEVNLKPLTDAIKSLETVIKGQKLPETDIQPVVNAVKTLNTSINSLSFPVPNYVLPFKDVDGKAVQVQLDADGKVPTSGGSSSSSTEGAATEDQQVSQNDILEEIRSAIQAVAATKGIASDIRVTLLGGTTAVTGSLTSAGTVSTVTTVTGLTNIGGLPAQSLITSTNNTTAVLSNINNVSV
jgi:hypothetical protein